MGEVKSGSHTGWTRTNNRHHFVFWQSTGRHEILALGHHPVCKKSLKHANGYCVTFFTPDTGPFTLKFMGTDPRANCRKGTCFANFPIPFFKFPVTQQGNKFRNIIIDWTPLPASGLFTLQTSVGLTYSSFFIKTRRYFLKIFNPEGNTKFLGLLPGNRHSLFRFHHLLLIQCSSLKNIIKSFTFG